MAFRKLTIILCYVLHVVNEDGFLQNQILFGKMSPWKHPNPYTDFWKFNHSSEEVLIWLKIDVYIINIYIWDSCQK